MPVGVASLGRRALHVGVGAGVGRVGQVLAARGVDAAVAVVGQREVDLAVGGVHGVPLGAVHLRGAHRVCGQAGVDGDVGSVGKLVRCVAGNGRVGQRQLDPCAGAVGIELGNVQLATVQVLVAHGHRVGGVCVGGAPQRGGDKLVDVFATGVVAHVHRQGLAHHDLAEGGAFVREAAQGGALLGGSGLVVGVDLNDVAHAVHFVAIVIAAVHRSAQLAVVPALVLVIGAAGFPAVARSGTLGAAVALQRRHALVVATGSVVGSATGEVAKPVFFARQEGAPGGLARTAVVQRAACLGAGGRELGDKLRAAARGARDVDGCERCQAEVLGRARQVRPLASRLGHFDHGNAVDGGFLVHFCGGAGQGGCAAVGVQEEGGELFVRGGFVVHREQATLGGVVVARAIGAQAKPLHTVVVVAGTLFKVTVGAVILVGRHAGRDGIAQGKQHAGGVTRGNAHHVGQALGHGAEAQQLGRAGHGAVVIVATATGRHAKAGQHGRAYRANATAQQATAGQACTQHRFKRGVGRGVGVFVVEVDGSCWRVHTLCHGVPCGGGSFYKTSGA